MTGARSLRTTARSRRCTDVYRKGADGLWVLHPFDAGATVTLASVALSLGAELLFAEVDGAAPADSAAPA